MRHPSAGTTASTRYCSADVSNLAVLDLIQVSRASIKGSISFLRSEHSHTIPTRQPAPLRRASLRQSRTTLELNLASQNSGRVAGLVANRQFVCRCQKHPRTSITARHRGNTMSGRPGNSRSCSLNLKPLACSARRKRSSGFVFAERMPDIIFDRVALSTTSTMFFPG